MGTKQHLVTIGGNIGSGKSSTGKGIAKELGYEHRSGGDFMRAIADDRSITLIELSKNAESDETIDNDIDTYVKKYEKSENMVIDSRLGYHWIPNSFKIFLKIPEHTAAVRMLEDKKINPSRANEHAKNATTPEDILESVNRRLASERMRYKALYHIDDHMDIKNYDLVIDTEKYNLGEVITIAIEKYKEWLEN